MRFRSRLTLRQILPVTGFTALITAFLLFSASYRREERQFYCLTNQLFCSEMLANTLNMHYTLADPSDFGIEDYEVILPCYSTENVLSGQTRTENLLKRLLAIDTGKLSVQSQVTHSLLVDSLQNSLELSDFSLYEEPLSPSSGMQSQLPILLAEYTFRSRRDVEDYLKLLDQTDDYFEALLRFEQEKAAAGLLMPSTSLKKVVEQCDTILKEDQLAAGTHFLQTTFRERLFHLVSQGGITQKDVESYEAQNNRLLRTVMLPAYIALGDGLLVLENPDIPLRGLASKPEGAVYYEKLLSSQTGSDRSVSEIKKMIVEQFDREYLLFGSILDQTPELAVLPYDTLLQEKFPLENVSAMLSDLQCRMEADFPPFDTGKDLPEVTVKTVSSSLEDYCAPAFYLTPPLDDTSSNAIYINEKSTPAGLELYTTLAHEGYPGHMYQSVYHNLAVMQKKPDPVTNVRELLWYGGYLEGWALYVEFLSYDYASELFAEQNQKQLAEAVQLTKYNRSLLLGLYSLLDIMIHHENCDLTQVSSLLANFGITDTSAVSSIYEYIVEEPTNYLKYYLGYLEILSLKEQAMHLWGDTYTDYDFHTFMLQSGPADFTTLREALKNRPSPKFAD